MAALAAIPAILISVALNVSLLTTTIWAPAAVFFSVLAILLSLVNYFAPLAPDKLKPGRRGPVVAGSLISLLFALLTWYYTSIAQDRLLAAINNVGIGRLAETLQKIELSGSAPEQRRIVEAFGANQFNALAGDVRSIQRRLDAIEAGILKRE